MKAIMQCIIHCKPLREHILSIPSPEPTRMCQELKEVVRACVEGLSAQDDQPRFKFDVFAPSSLIDTLIECHDGFVLGEQQDASELLAHFMEATGLEEACCRVSSAAEGVLPRRSSGVVLLNNIPADSALQAIARHKPIHVEHFLNVAFQVDDVMLRAAPQVLVVALPQILDSGLEDGDEPA